MLALHLYATTSTFPIWGLQIIPESCQTPHYWIEGDTQRQRQIALKTHHMLFFEKQGVKWYEIWHSQWPSESPDLPASHKSQDSPESTDSSESPDSPESLNCLYSASFRLCQYFIGLISKCIIIREGFKNPRHGNPPPPPPPLHGKFPCRGFLNPSLTIII